ncbi:hypothetical protein FA15DRAFT_673595, partial [Coprinopsis marcescibilis]
MADSSSKVYNSFFYGTLMHPKILTRVIGNEGTHLRFCPAILLDHTRHRIKNGDYPGVIPYSAGRELFSRELTQEERSVRGIFVTGLTESDMTRLDLFEGVVRRTSIGLFISFFPLDLSRSNFSSFIMTHLYGIPIFPCLCSPDF